MSQLKISDALRGSRLVTRLNEIFDSLAPGGAAWGSVTGTLSNQTDLQTALDAKAATSSLSTVATSGAYSDLTGKPTLGTAAATASADYATAAQGALADTALQNAGAFDASGTASAAVATHVGLADPHAQYALESSLGTLATQSGTFSGTSSGTNTGDNATNTQYSGLAASKQDTLVSATNIKTVNGSSILGSGDLVVSSGYHLVATLAGNQATGANTTPVTLTGLVFSFIANSVYFFRWIGKVQPAAATTGCGFQLDVSAAVTEICMGFYHQLANTGTLSGGHSIADDASVGVSSGMPGTSTYPVIGQGMLRSGANSGTAQLRFRSETSAVTTAIAGMTLVVEKVA